MFLENPLCMIVKLIGAQIVDRKSMAFCRPERANVAWVDVSEECETDVFADVEFVDEVVPDFGLVFFAGWFWWAVWRADFP